LCAHGVPCPAGEESVVTGKIDKKLIRQAFADYSLPGVKEKLG
jgi:hypothetical protein